MKRCPGCEREIDKLSIACEYCGKLNKKETPAGAPWSSGKPSKNNPKNGTTGRK